ncbi:hypothetical protein HAX54_043318 [Datura stramonium]|uniref:Uncharacterized protein n=1 Tax=Datura stramonium TaxID=4076 RepID=A0ABS8W0U1_DATST|nr:hypothetical protein [Datura stramonium]
MPLSAISSNNRPSQMPRVDFLIDFPESRLVAKSVGKHSLESIYESPDEEEEGEIDEDILVEQPPQANIKSLQDLEDSVLSATMERSRKDTFMVGTSGMERSRKDTFMVGTSGTAANLEG